VEITANNYLNSRPKTLAEANQVILLLKENNQIQQERIQAIEQQYENLQQQIINLLRGKYGKSSERLPEGFIQLNLLDGSKSLEQPIEESIQKETITYDRKKRNGHRNIPDTLPRVRIEHKLEDLTCPCGCGNQLYKIGEIITEQLEIVPAKIYVKQHVRFKYAGCLHQNQVITAPMPNQPIDKGFAGPGLLADVLVKKYDDHLPLYRQSEILARHGIDISRQTLCDWVMQCADILQPIVEAMLPDLLASPKIHTDDTVIPVLEEGRDSTKEGRLWGYLGCGPPCVIYDYSPNRQQRWAEEFLKNYKGYLQADAYTGYDKIYADGNIVEVACMAHARRKFFEIVQTNKKISNSKEGLAVTALSYIGKLYKIESRIKDLEPRAKKAIRKREATPILKAYKKWLLRQSSRVLPKSPLGHAVSYTLKNWIALTRYLGSGILSIDNSAAERLMRPIAVGRGNWTFAGNDRGGKAAATVYSLIESCKLNEINPYEYLLDVLTRIPNTLNRDIRSLLPYKWQPQTP
jgi:Transposase and inactivated derivatives